MKTRQPKETYKRLVKKHIISYWESKLRAEAEALTSLAYFQPNFMSLKTPHPLWSSAGSSPYEVTKAIVQARMLSGRYRTEELCSHWSVNTNGWCRTNTCKNLNIVEDLDHILTKCKSLNNTRIKLLKFTKSYVSSHPILIPTIELFCDPEHPLFCQFLLDCSVIPHIISMTQTYGIYVLQQLFYIGRTWCYSLHRERLKLLGLWSPF